MKVEGVSKAEPVLPVRPVPRETDGNKVKLPVAAVEKRRGVTEESKDPKAVEKAVELINKTMENYNTELQFTLHEGSGEYVVKIINTKDHSVIREIPPERVLDMVAHFKKMLGLIVDKFI